MNFPLLVVGVLTNVAIFAVFLFVPAGTVHWPRAWVFLGVAAALATWSMVTITPGNEALLKERWKPPVQRGQPLADKLIVVPFILSFLGVIGLIPLDVFRLHLLGSPGPVAEALGLGLFAVGWWIITLALRENAFAAPVVKHQAERGQVVVDTGVYGIVRHPMYAGALLVVVGMPLWLESNAAALFALVPINLMALRVVFEEQFLKKELEGYEEYTTRVRYRLIPGVW